MNKVITITEEELNARIAAAIAASKTVVASAPASVIRQVKPVEDRGGVKALRFLQRGLNTSIDFTTTRVVAPVETYVEDSLIPDTLTVVAVGSGKAASWLDSLSKASANKAQALRPAVDPTDPMSVLKAMSKDELVAFIASRQVSQ